MSSSRKVWLVTGASRGMGFDIARAAAKAGHTVIAASRQMQPWPEEENGEVIQITMDVTDACQVQEAVDAVLDQFGRIDVLVNNAGFAQVGWFETVSDGQIQRQFDVNLFGAMRVTRAVLPSMRECRSGHIVSLSSIAGVSSLAGGAIYSASKFAFEGWMEGLAEELAPFGIRSTSLVPGFFRTEFLGSNSAVFGSLEIADYAEVTQERKALLASLDGTQPGDPKRLAKLLVELVASDHPPTRLLLGSDACSMQIAKSEQRIKETEEWRRFSLGTDFPNLS